VVNLIVSIITLPLLLHFLGKSYYGIYAMLISIISVLSFTDLGLSLGLLNSVPNYKIDRDPSKLSKAITGSFLISVIISFILLIFFLLLFPMVDWNQFFNVKDFKPNGEISRMVFVFFILYLLGAPFNVANNYLVGNQQAYIVEVGRAIGNILMLILIYLAIRLSLPPSALVAISFTPTTIVYFIIFIILFFILSPRIRPRLRHYDKKTSRELLSLGSRYFLLQIFAILFISIDPIIIGKIINVTAVTDYSIMYRIATILSMPAVLFINQLLPAMNDAFVKFDRQWIKRGFYRILYSSLVYVAIITSILGIFGDRVLLYWLGPDIKFDFIHWIAVCALLLLTIFNTLFSMIFLMPALVRYNLFLFPIVVSLLFVGKVILLNTYNLSTMVIVSSLFYLIAFCIPGYFLLKREKFI